MVFHLPYSRFTDLARHHSFQSSSNFVLLSKGEVLYCDVYKDFCITPMSCREVGVSSSVLVRQVYRV